MDSSLLESARRPRKQQDVFPVDEDGDASESQTSGGYNVETTYSDDSEAAWTVKGKKFCYGYKAHIAVDAEHGFILAGHATPANRPDCKEMMTVVRAVVCKQGLRSLRKRATAASNIDMSWKLLGISMGSCIKPPATGPFPSPNAWSFEPSADSAAERSGLRHTEERSSNGPCEISGGGQGRAAATPGRNGLQPQEGSTNG